MIRAFLAVEPPDELRTRLAALRQEITRKIAPDLSREVRLSWVRPESLHLTVKFLGDIDEQSVAPMRQAIARAVAAHRAIVVPIERLGVFPGLQRARVLWAGPSAPWEQREDAARLTGLHRAVEDCCVALNLAPDGRALSPHLTLARIKEGETAMGRALAKSGVLDRPLAGNPFVIDSIVLVKSDLKPTGSVYTKLWEVKLPEH